MTKRALAGVLWFLSGWWIGAFVAFALGISPLIAPVAAAAAAGFFAGDPLRIIWTRPAPKAVVASTTVETAPEAT